VLTEGTTGKVWRQHHVIQETVDRIAQHSLFNWQNKYANIKNELAAAYIRRPFYEEAGVLTPYSVDFEAMDEFHAVLAW